MIIIFLIGVIKRKLAQSPQTVKDGSEQESEPNYEDIPSPTREKETAFNFTDNCCYAGAGVPLYDVIHSPDSVDEKMTTMESRNFDTLTVDLNSCAKDLEHEGSA